MPSVSPDEYLRRLGHPEVWPGGEAEVADGPHLIMIIILIVILIMMLRTVSPRITRNSLMFQSGKCDSFMMVTCKWSWSW